MTVARDHLIIDKTIEELLLSALLPNGEQWLYHCYDRPVNIKHHIRCMEIF